MRSRKQCGKGVEVDYNTSTVYIEHGKPGTAGMPALDTALEQWKKLVEGSGIILELRERQYFKPPSQRKHEQRQKLLRRRFIEQKRHQKGGKVKKYSRRETARE